MTPTEHQTDLVIWVSDGLEQTSCLVEVLAAVHVEALAVRVLQGKRHVVKLGVLHGRRCEHTAERCKAMFVADTLTVEFWVWQRHLPIQSETQHRLPNILINYIK